MQVTIMLRGARSVVVIAVSTVTLVAAPWFTDVFPLEEFAARRARLMAEIGDAMAVLQGAAERPAEAPFRQTISSSICRASKCRAPSSSLTAAPRARRCSWRTTAGARAWGPLLQPDEEAKRVTGIESVRVREDFDGALDATARDRRIIYTPQRPEVLGSGSGGTSSGWDGRSIRSTRHPRMSSTPIASKASCCSWLARWTPTSTLPPRCKS
jgi:hypothetical protein